MTIRNKPCGYWTELRCQEEAKKYSTKTQFCKNSNGAYTAALKNGWLNEICKHMIVKWKYMWTKDACIKEAQKYRTSSEFSKNAPSAYTAAMRHGWLSEVQGHMKLRLKIWNYDTCKAEALKYTNRKEFAKKADSSYTHALKKGWLDEICDHMEPLGNMYKRAIYAFEFSDKSVYVGLTFNLEKRKYDHLNNKKSAVFIHINNFKHQFIFKIINDYIDKKEAVELEKFWVKQYKKEGWNILNRAKAGALGGGWSVWNKEKCIEVALQSNSRSEFHAKYSGAYNSSLRNGWIDEIRGYLPVYQNLPKAVIIRKRRVIYNYSYEECKAEALKYKTRVEFKNKNQTAYCTVVRNKWLNPLCNHMPKHYQAITKWTKNACYQEALKYETKRDFRKNSQSAYSTSVQRKWIDDICTHMSKPPHNRKWTKEKCQDIALQFKCRQEFKKEQPSVYTTAVINGWIDEICCHIPKRCIRKWDKESIFNLASSFKKLYIFKRTHQYAYQIAKENNWLDEIKNKINQNN